MIVVIDSGVWISAFHFGGTPLAALNRAHLDHRVAISGGILSEVRLTLTRKFLWNAGTIEKALATFLANAMFVETSGTLRSVCRDPKDDMVLECAVTAGARILVSGDKDLLALESYEDIRMLSPRGYLSEPFGSGV